MTHGRPVQARLSGGGNGYTSKRVSDRTFCKVRRCRHEQLKLVTALYGSPSWARTSDPLINSQLLYQLSYRGIGWRV